MSRIHPSIVTITDDVQTPDTDNRQYRAVKLENELKICIICDPDADKAAASMNVNIGHMTDPDDMNGLAHFCEHMLFLGTKKYPRENTYTDFIATHGGRTNAYTAPEATNYHFDVAPDEIEDALDIFAQFFLDPLFTESATEREINAVDSENQKNIQSDNWRMNQLNCSLSKPGHDYGKFGTGNMVTLDKNPKARGLNVREELLKFHKKYYSANLMALTVISKEPLDRMTEYVCNLFSTIENKSVEPRVWKDHPYGPTQLAKRVCVVPVKDLRWLSVVWPCPDLHPYWESRPDHYLSHLLGHEGPGSLLSALKAKHWVNNLTAGGKRGATGFSFMIIDVDLTQEGLDHVDDIITMFYQYIQMLKSNGPQQWIFDEGKGLDELNYRFKDADKPLSSAIHLAGMMRLYPMSEIVSGPYLWKMFKPELITDLLNLLEPSKMINIIVSKSFAGKTDLKEKWYGVEHSIEPISQSLLDKWSDPGENELLCLPQTNEFIPHNFDLVERDPEQIPFPRIIKNTPLSRVWFKQDEEFKLPKGCISVAIRSPVVSSSPANANLTWLFLRLFNDAFAEYSYDAELTKLKYGLSTTRYGFLLNVSGYTDKLGVLLKTVMNTLTKFQGDGKRVDIFREEYIRSLRNFAMNSPTHHAEYHLSLLMKEGSWTVDELLDASDEMTLEDLRNFIPQLFSRMHLEMLLFGNFTPTSALCLVDIIEESLVKNAGVKPLPQSQHSRARREVQLPDDSSYLFEGLNDTQPSSCIYNYYQLGMEDTKSIMRLELFLQIIKDPCYNTLRTVEQLGYICQAGLRRSGGVHAMLIIVQSPKHPEYVNFRIETFLSTVKNVLENLSEADYQKHVAGLVTQRLSKPKKIKQRHSRYWNEIVSEIYFFDRDRVETDYVKTITKSQLIDFFMENLSVESKRRHKMTIQILAKEHRDSYTVSEDSPDAGSFTPPTKAPEKVLNHTDFKRGMQLFPLPKPSVDVSRSKSKL